MPKCPIYGTVLEKIMVEDGVYVDDDCPRCGPRGYEMLDEEDDNGD